MSRRHSDRGRTGDEPVNEAIRQHQVSCEDWGYQALAEDLHVWAKRMNVEFKLNIPTPALMIDRLRSRALGRYRAGRNGFGLRDEVTIATRHVHEHEYWDVLGTLCHELLHVWQDYHGQPAYSSAFNYHNVEFRRQAENVGLIVDRWGHSELAEGNTPFRALLGAHDVVVPELPELPRRRPGQGTSTLKLWICPCGVRARVGRAEFHAKCLDCGGVFARQD